METSANGLKPAIPAWFTTSCAPRASQLHLSTRAAPADRRSGAVRPGLHHRGPCRRHRRPAPDAGRMDGLLSRRQPKPSGCRSPMTAPSPRWASCRPRPCRAKGVLGCVIDGGIRDAGFLKQLGFQCWRRFHTPRDVVERWLPSRIEVPVIIGDVVIDPGDFLLGDEDGMVRVPAASPTRSRKPRGRPCRPKTKVPPPSLPGRTRRRLICNSASSGSRRPP